MSYIKGCDGCTRKDQIFTCMIQLIEKPIECICATCLVKGMCDIFCKERHLQYIKLLRDEDQRKEYESLRKM